MKHLLVILVLSILMACKGSKVLNDTNTSVNTKDTVIKEKEVIWKDTIIYIKGDSIPFQIPCNEKSDTSFIMTKGKYKLVVNVKDGKADILSLVDSDPIIITKYKEIFKESNSHKRDSSKVEIVTTTVEVPYTPWYYLYPAFLGYILIGYLLFRIGRIFTK